MYGYLITVLSSQWIWLPLSSPPQGGVPEWSVSGGLSNLQTFNQWCRSFQPICPYYNILSSDFFFFFSCFCAFHASLQQSECWKEENETGSGLEVWSGEIFRSDSRCFFSNIIREVQSPLCRFVCACFNAAKHSWLFLFILLTLPNVWC